VPYRGGAPALTDLLGQQRQLYWKPLTGLNNSNDAERLASN